MRRTILVGAVILILAVGVSAAPAVPIATEDEPVVYGPWGECDNGLSGDANCSCVTDIWDYWNFVLPALWSEPGDNTWRPGADLNRDGVVDWQDEQLVGTNLGRTCMHEATGTGPDQWGFYWNVTELADGTPWPPEFCTDSGDCWRQEWNEYGWYQWVAR